MSEVNPGGSRPRPDGRALDVTSDAGYTWRWSYPALRPGRADARGSGGCLGAGGCRGPGGWWALADAGHGRTPVLAGRPATGCVTRARATMYKAGFDAGGGSDCHAGWHVRGDVGRTSPAYSRPERAAPARVHPRSRPVLPR